MDKGRVEADSTAEKSLLAELKGHLKSFLGRTEIDEVERLVAGVIGSSHGPRDDGVIAWTTVAGGDAAEG